MPTMLERLTRAVKERRRIAVGSLSGSDLLAVGVITDCDGHSLTIRQECLDPSNCDVDHGEVSFPVDHVSVLWSPPPLESAENDEESFDDDDPHEEQVPSMRN